jgi:hypothetical protein
MKTCDIPKFGRELYKYLRMNPGKFLTSKEIADVFNEWDYKREIVPGLTVWWETCVHTHIVKRKRPYKKGASNGAGYEYGYIVPEAINSNIVKEDNIMPIKLDTLTKKVTDTIYQSNRPLTAKEIKHAVHVSYGDTRVDTILKNLIIHETLRCWGNPKVYVWHSSKFEDPANLSNGTTADIVFKELEPVNLSDLTENLYPGKVIEMKDKLNAVEVNPLDVLAQMDAGMLGLYLQARKDKEEAIKVLNEIRDQVIAAERKLKAADDTLKELGGQLIS